jgi:hypothetical protein
MPVCDPSLLNNIKKDNIINLFRSITGKYYELELNRSTTNISNNAQLNHTVEQHQLSKESNLIYYMMLLLFVVALLVITIFCCFIKKKRRLCNSNDEIELTKRTVLSNSELKYVI